MGLDMFAYKAKFKPSKEVDFNDEIPEEGVEDLAYWRKHPDLHGHMKSLYYQKGGDSEQFNCVPVQLTREDLDQLAATIIDEELPETSGFFFGQSSGDKEEANRDLQFCKDAIQAIEEGYTVWYDSWW